MSASGDFACPPVEPMNWWEYIGIYAAMFVLSPPFIVGGGGLGILGLLMGWWARGWWQRRGVPAP